MKKFNFFSVAIAVVMALFVSGAWAGQQKCYFSPTPQAMFPTGSTTMQSPTVLCTLTGPTTSTIDSVIVEGTFGASSCIVIERTWEMLNSNLGRVGGPTTFSDGKFKVKILPLQSGLLANGKYYFRFNAKRIVSDPCAASISPGTGTATFYYTP